MNFRIEARDDLRGEVRRRGKGSDGVAAKFIGPKDATAVCVAELDRSKVLLAIALQTAEGDVLRFRQGSRALWCLASQRKGRASGDHAYAAQFRNAKDNVAGEAVGVRSIPLRRRHEWHYQERRSPRERRLSVRWGAKTRDLDHTRSSRLKMRPLRGG